MPKGKMTVMPMMKVRSFLKKNWKFLLTFLIGLFVTNQAIQPIFSPRISSISYTPLYIQGNEIYNETKYYLISKITYNIDVPLFLLDMGNWNTNIIWLKIPKNFEFNEKEYLISSFLENNPYIEYPEWIFHNDSLISCEKFEGKIPIKIKENGFNIKSISLNLYVAEELKKEIQPSIAYSNYWWVETRTFLSGLPITSGYGNLIGFVKLSGRNDTVYIVYEYVLKNIGSLEVKGYRETIYGGEELTVCDGNIRLWGPQSKNSQTISIDLKPQQIKRLIIIYRVTPEMIMIDYPIYNLTRVDCLSIQEVLK